MKQTKVRRRRVKTRDYTKVPSSTKAKTRKQREYTGDEEDVTYKSKNPPPSYIPRRIAEFPGNTLELRSDQLYCAACSKVFTLWKKSVVRAHIRTPSHIDNLQHWNERETKKTEVVPHIEEFQAQENLQGRKTVPLEAKVYRQHVCSVLLGAEIPISKLENAGFRALLQDKHYDLGGRQGVSEWVKFVRDRFIEETKQEILDECVSVIFDGTMRNTEAYTFVLRFVKDRKSNAWTISQRVAELRLVDSSVDGQQLAMLMADVLVRKYQIGPSRIPFVMRDGSRINDVCISKFQGISKINDIKCFSHMLNRVLNALPCDLVVKFTNRWGNICARSANLRLDFQDKVGVPLVRFSRIRWASRWQCANQIFEHWDRMKTLLETTSCCEKGIQKCLNLFQPQLRMELAITVDFGKIITEAIYELEGDGFLALKAYDVIKNVEKRLQLLVDGENSVRPNTVRLAQTTGEEKQNLKLAQQKCKKANEYFQEQLAILEPQMNIFKAARLFSPRYVAAKPCNPGVVEDLRAISFANVPTTIGKLKQEFPDYHTLAEGCESGTNLLAWWPRVSGQIPTWVWACKMMMLCQPSSAAAERVFAVLREAVGEQRQSALEDYQSVSVMVSSRVDREEVKDM